MPSDGPKWKLNCISVNKCHYCQYMYLQCRLSQNLVCLSFRHGLSPIVAWCVATWAMESFSFLTILSTVQLSNPRLNTSGLHTGTCTQNLTNLMGRAYWSGYSTMMDWERKVSRRRDCIEYITIQKKDIPALLPIPTYWESNADCCDTIIFTFSISLYPATASLDHIEKKNQEPNTHLCP